MERDRINHLKQYIQQFQAGCNAYLAPLCDPRNKRVFVIGSGWGTEIYWALSKGAKAVVGIDPAPRSTEALDEVIQESFRKKMHYETYQGILEEYVVDEKRKYDLILSHNVFEHIEDVLSTLRVVPKILKDNGRLAIFTDPLFFSSAGSHLNIEPWEHLWGDLEAKKDTFPGYQWHGYKALNRMTASDFIGYIKESDGMALQFFLKPDRNLNKFQHYRERIAKKCDASILDLTTEGISVEIAWNL